MEKKSPPRNNLNDIANVEDVGAREEGDLLSTSCKMIRIIAEEENC